MSSMRVCHHLNECKDSKDSEIEGRERERERDGIYHLWLNGLGLVLSYILRENVFALISFIGHWRVSLSATFSHLVFLSLWLVAGGWSGRKLCFSLLSHFAIHLLSFSCTLPSSFVLILTFLLTSIYLNFETKGPTVSPSLYICVQAHFFFFQPSLSLTCSLFLHPILQYSSSGCYYKVGGATTVLPHIILLILWFYLIQYCTYSSPHPLKF